MQKKRKLRKWVLYLSYMVALVLLFIVGNKTGVIKASKNALDITNLVIIIMAWELLKTTIKACIKREKQEN